MSAGYLLYSAMDKQLALMHFATWRDLALLVAPEENVLQTEISFLTWCVDTLLLAKAQPHWEEYCFVIEGMEDINPRFLLKVSRKGDDKTCSLAFGVEHSTKPTAYFCLPDFSGGLENIADFAEGLWNLLETAESSLTQSSESQGKLVQS